MAESRRGRLPAIALSWWIVGIVTVLCAFGLVMVGSASQVISVSYYGSAWSFLIKEIEWFSIGVLAFAFAITMGYQWFRKLAPVLVVGTLLLLVAVQIPGVGSSSYGSTRWIEITSSVAIQPSEIMKLALALFGASVIAKRLDDGSSPRSALGPALIVAAAAAVLVVTQPDLGTTIVLVMIMLTLAFAAGTPKRFILRWMLILSGAVAVMVWIQPYQRARLFSFIDPGSKSAEGGYQVVQSLIGMGSGSVGGLGLGNSREKWGLLPNAHTDFIFSVIGEELGLIGAVVVVVLFGALAIKGWQVAERSTDRFGMLLGSALVAWISVEAVINMCAVLGLLPVTGIPLPFVSYGGTSMVVTLFAAGLLVSIARSAEGRGAGLLSRSAETKPAKRGGRKPKPASPSSRPRSAAGAARSSSAGARRR